MSDNLNSTNNTQTKYIIIGLIFWALVVVVIIALMQTLNQDPSKTNVVVSNKTKQWSVQIASFYDDVNLKKLQQKLQKSNFKTYLIFSLDSKKQVLKDLRVGPFGVKHLAEKAKASIKHKFKIDGQIIVIE